MSDYEVVQKAMVYLKSVIRRRLVAKWACCVRKMGKIDFEYDYIQVVMNLLAIQQRERSTLSYTELSEWLKILSYFQNSSNKIEKRISNNIHTKLIEENNKNTWEL
jgi:hypothetical protein